MEKVIYVGYYSCLDGDCRTRNYSLAAAKKMDFVASALTEIGMQIEIVSPAYITDSGRYYKAEEHIQIAPNTQLTLTPSWGCRNKLMRVARVLYSKWWLFRYLLSHANEQTPVIVYHNYEIAIPLIVAQKIKRFPLLLEIEEQYSMVWKLSRYNQFKENLLLRYGKDRSLVVSELLAEKLGVMHPIVSYGNYNAFKGIIPEKGKNNTVQLIYTGSVDKVKNSAYLAMEVMPLLPEHYELKISGPIAKGEDDLFIQTLDAINRKCGRKACEYLGVLGEEDYSDLLLHADIALNLQQEGEFGQFLFPSKILTYLSYNLAVVTTRGDSIVKSSVADIVYFSDDYSLEKIAERIVSIDLHDSIDRRKRLNEMSERFLKELETVLLT